MAGGTQAYASPVRWDNPPVGHPEHFEWRGPLGTENWLNLTQPAASQSETPSAPSSLGQTEIEGFGLLFSSASFVLEMEVVVALRIICKLWAGVTPIPRFYPAAAEGVISPRSAFSFSRSPGVSLIPRQRFDTSTSTA